MMYGYINSKCESTANYFHAGLSFNEKLLGNQTKRKVKRGQSKQHTMKKLISRDLAEYLLSGTISAVEKMNEPILIDRLKLEELMKERFLTLSDCYDVDIYEKDGSNWHFIFFNDEHGNPMSFTTMTEEDFEDSIQKSYNVDSSQVAHILNFYGADDLVKEESYNFLHLWELDRP